jgi:hypothetical protein
MSDQSPQQVTSSEIGTPSERFETRVEQVRAIPLAITERPGQLRLADGRLSFTPRRGHVIFDAPLDDFHSFAPAFGGQGFHLWHGETRYRFRIPTSAGRIRQTPSPNPSESSPGPSPTSRMLGPTYVTPSRHSRFCSWVRTITT